MKNESIPSMKYSYNHGFLISSRERNNNPAAATKAT